MRAFKSRFEFFRQPGNEKLILIGTTLGIWVILSVLFISYGYEETWQLWGVPTVSPFFTDFRIIPDMIANLHIGFDPTLPNPVDPRFRIFNYPRIWYLLAYTNISQDDTLWFGILLIALFFLSVFVFPGKLAKNDIIFMMLVLFSPAAMLLYERANLDLLIFFLCAVAVAASETAAPAAAITLFAAALLKLFPVFGIGIFLTRGKQVFLSLLIYVTVPFALYLFLTRQNVQASWSLTERGIDISYGATVFVTYFKPVIVGQLGHWIADQEAIPVVLSWTSYLAALLIMLFYFWTGIFRAQRLTASSQRNLNGFWMGGAIYVGTFLLGNNWDYRLAFLVLVVPQLAEWVRSSVGKQRSVAIVVMGLILLSCWYLFYNRHPYDLDHKTLFVLDEILNWSLFAGLTYLLAAAAPEWIRAMAKAVPSTTPDKS